MNVLVVTNTYPPYYVGGYELGCRDAVEGLIARGHRVTVLTSTYPVQKVSSEGPIHRYFTLTRRPPTLREVVAREFTNQRIFLKFCRYFKPQVVFFWNLTDISMVLGALARQIGIASCYYVFDTWLSNWESDPWCRATASYRWLAGAANLFGIESLCNGFPLSNTIFASHFLREITESMFGSVRNSALVPWGVDPGMFSSNDREVEFPPRRMLYVGQIVRHKGIDIAVQALSIIVAEYDLPLELTIVGDLEQDLDYSSHLMQLIHSNNLEHIITMAGKISRQSLPGIYSSHNIVVFPSIWDEPFGLTLLEAMASGCVVVASGTGGSTDFLVNDRNALIYPKDDPDACAVAILRLCGDRDLLEKLRRNGRNDVCSRYTLNRAIDDIEEYLANLLTL